MTDAKVDPESTWMRVKWLAPVVAITVAATVVYMQMVTGQQRSDERLDRLANTVADLSNQVQRMFIDVVMTRQGQAWIEMARALNREKRPDVVFPDLPR